MNVRAVALAVAIAAAAGCGGGGDTPASPSGESSLSGLWTGRANGIEPADFSMSLTQNGSAIAGSGQVFFPGDQTRLTLSITGSLSGAAVTLNIQPASRAMVNYQGTLDGRAIAGRLNGGDVQHDGPFVNTALTLLRQ